MPQEVIEVTEREVEIIEVIERGPVGPTGPQPNINYEVVTSSRTVTSRQLIAADTSGGSFTLTLPANPAAGDAVDIFDYAETFDTNPLTIARNGQPIESLNEDLVANVEGAYFTLIYTGATRGWQVLPRYGTSGGGGESALTTQGDMLYRGVGINTRLPIGSAGQILKVNSGATAPEWGEAPATGVTSVSGTAPIASSGGATPTISITPATTSAAGSMSSADKTKLDGIAANANNYTHPNHSGDVTSSGDGATTIANDAVTNAKLANVATSTIKGRATAGTGDPEDLTATQVRTILNVADGAEVNVQSNWTEADSGSDAFILNKPTLGGAAALNVGTTTGTVAAGDDARLSDSRTPTAHAASHAVGGSDPVFDQDLNTTDVVTFTGLQVANFIDGSNREFFDDEGNTSIALTSGADGVRLFAPITPYGDAAATIAATTLANLGGASDDHAHGNITSDGKLGTTAGLPVVTTTAGAVTTLALGTANQVLKVNSGGTAVEFGAAGGVTSGSVDNAVLRADGTGGSTSQGSAFIIADNATASPNNTVNHASIQATGDTTNVSVSIVPKGTGAFMLQVPNSAASGGNVRGANSVDLQTSRATATQVASGTNAVVLGGVNCTASGFYAVAGGSNSTASGEGAIAIGLENSASGLYGTALGRNNTASNNSVVAIGAFSTASGSRSVALSWSNTASGTNSCIIGGTGGLADRSNLKAHSSGSFAASGDSQHIEIVLRAKTTTNSAVELLANNALVTDARLTCPSGKIISGIINIHGIKSDGTASAHYVRQFQVKNVGGTSTYPYTAAIVGTDYASSTSITFNDPDTNDALSVSVTGIASETWRWTAHVSAVETAYGS